MDQLKSKIRTQDTETILDCIIKIGGGLVDEATRMVRAALIDVYAERTSASEADLVMDLIGL